MASDKTTPAEGEAWRNSRGAIRYVRSVDDFSVVYSRPAPAHPDWIAVELSQWNIWVERTGARRIRRGGGVQSDWEYITWRIRPLLDMRDSLARALGHAREEVDHLEQQYDDLTRKLLELGADV